MALTKKFIFFRIRGIILLAAAVIVGAIFLSQELFSQTGKEFERKIPTKRFKILHIMSYHSPWKWTDDQLNGFKEALKGLDIEFKVFQMDTKRRSSELWKQEVGRQARDLIDSWRPDLVYTNDDNAQIYVTKHYINSSIPFVFSGVNADPEDYGFTKSKNIAGVLEKEHFVQSVRLLQEIVPDVTKIAVITDEDPTWPKVISRMQKKAPNELREIEFISWEAISTFSEYKQKIKEYENKADAVCLLGIFTFKDENGDNVPFEEVARWTAENSRLPEFTFWKDRIPKGHLCTVTVSGYEQGYAAGKIARGILAEGRSPLSYSFEPTVKGEPVLSLARAKKLGLNIKSSILLTAQVVEKFEWENR